VDPGMWAWLSNWKVLIIIGEISNEFYMKNKQNSYMKIPLERNEQNGFLIITKSGRGLATGKNLF
jgi:hypothetical protein